MKNKREHLMPRFEGQLIRSNPHGLSKIQLKNDEREMMELHALDIFTKCSNSGLPLRDILVSLLITGMDWGVNAARENVVIKPHFKYNEIKNAPCK